MPAVKPPAILERLRGVQRAGDGWLAFCPAHDDRHKRSLSITVAADGKTLVNCHARGCRAEDIAAAVEMRMADLGADAENGHRAPRREVATYDYTDERGALLYQVVRFEPKDFRCRRPDGRGGWAWNLDGVRIVPYRVHELPEARRVYIPEGERDCDTLKALGLTATTNHGGAGKWRAEQTQALVATAVPEVVVLRDNDTPGAAHQEAVARACAASGLRVKRLALPGLPPLRDKHGEDVSDWLAAGHTLTELEALADAAPVFEVPPMDTLLAESGDEAAGPELQREGLDLALAWPDGVRFALTAIYDTREGVRGELTVMHRGRRLSWGAVLLSSISGREGLRKKLAAAASEVPWGDYLEETAFRLTEAARQGEPLVTLTGTPSSRTRELLPRFLYEGEPTLLYADGDTGKSLVALAVAAAMESGKALPFGLTPAQATPAAYLDWETSCDTLETRLGPLARGLGIDPPAILYRRMHRPLVVDAAPLAAEFARRRIGIVIIDSMVLALAGGDGAAFHEPVTAFYNALRLFAPAASLVLNHVPNEAARHGGLARPFGGAFAFNVPRLIWEARRDRTVDDATVIVFTCQKANNLVRRPAPFALRFQPGDGCTTVYPFDVGEAGPQAVAGMTITQQLRAALARGPMTVEALAETMDRSESTIRKELNRRRDTVFVTIPDTRPQQWGVASTR